MIHLSRELVADLEVPTRNSVCAVLQQAIELEHAAIPPYLYALYSLDPQKNGTICSILQSVVVEEMLHLLLAANVLNALGGRPSLSDGGLVPTYPTKLPGTVEGSLVMHLAPFSMSQLDAFLTLESPDDPLAIQGIAATPEGSVTIGEFYGAILTALAKLDPREFIGSVERQIGPDVYSGSVAVTDLPSARAAIATIVEQGEGTTTSPEEVAGRGFAHYYRLQQIREGRLLVKDGAPPPGGPAYSFSGDPVVFDPSGVYAVPTDPKASDYPAGSPSRRMCDAFNAAYTSLLGMLHGLCNGSATSAAVDNAIGQMMSLKKQATAMMAGIPNPTIVVGPSFEVNTASS